MDGLISFGLYMHPEKILSKKPLSKRAGAKVRTRTSTEYADPVPSNVFIMSAPPDASPAFFSRHVHSALQINELDFKVLHQGHFEFTTRVRVTTIPRFQFLPVSLPMEGVLLKETVTIPPDHLSGDYPTLVKLCFDGTRDQFYAILCSLLRC
jgi:hypothetical protein